MVTHTINSKTLLFLALLLITLLFLSLGSALTSYSFIKDESKQLEKGDTITQYGEYEIYDHKWWDILKIWTGEKVKEVELIENTPECSDNCFAIKEITNLKPAHLIEDVRFFRDFGDGKWVLWNGFTNWRVLVEEDVEQFETICKDGKEIFNEKNGTSYFEQDCSQVSTGFVKQWLPLDYKKDYEGTYRVKLEGGKKPSTILDWQVKINGYWTNKWAVWGGVIGVGGVQANVTLNSPADGSTALSNPVTFSAFANITGGAFIRNLSFCSNITGSWSCGDSVNLSVLSGLVSHYNLDETSGTIARDSLSLANITNVNAQVNQSGRIFNSYFLNNNANLNRSTAGLSTTAGSTSFWIYPTAFNAQDGYFDTHAANVGALRIYIASNNVNNICFELGGFIPHCVSHNMMINNWHFITLNWDSISQTLFIDGVLRGLAGSGGISLNRIQYGVFNLNNFASARFDEISLFNRTLNLSEITALYNSGAGSRPTSNNLVQTWSKTIPSGTTLWNVRACDSDGDCGFAVSNYTVSSTVPSLTINAGNGTQNHGSLAQNHTINFTVTDINLDRVWLNYNGTNRTITGVTSGVMNQARFALVKDLYTATIYVNDTAGNVRSEVVSWDYKVFENSRTSNSTSHETAYESFSINLTANSSLTAVSLLYNGTSYPMTNSGSGIWTYGRDLPSSVLGNNSINYRFTYAGDTINSTHLTHQNVMGISWAVCTAGTRYLNLIFKDEVTLGDINATVPLADFTYYLGTGTETKTYQYINNSVNVSTHRFCFTPVTRNVYVDSRIQYASTVYPQRVWNPDVITYSNTTTNQVLYLLSNTNGIYVTLQVINTADQVLSGVEIAVEREISGNDVVVGQGTTGLDGTVTFWLNPDFVHDFTFSKSGFKTFETSFQPTQSSYTITLGGGAVVPNNYFKGITFSITPTNQSLVNDTEYSFGFLLSSSFWDLDEYGFNLRLPNGTIISGDSTSTSGTQLTKSYNTGSLSRIYIDYYWVIEGEYTNASKYWNVYNTANTQWSIKTWFSDLNAYMTVGIFGLDDFGRYLIVFIIIFMTVGILSYKYGLTSPVAVTTSIFLIILFFEVIVNLIPPIRGIDNLLTYVSGLILAMVILKEVSQ